jgi:hypothetical protein
LIDACGPFGRIRLELAIAIIEVAAGANPHGVVVRNGRDQITDVCQWDLVLQ